MQTAVVWPYFTFIKSGQNHLAKRSKRGEENKANKGRGAKTTSGNGQAWSLVNSQRAAENMGNWRKMVAITNNVENIQLIYLISSRNTRKLGKNQKFFNP